MAIFEVSVSLYDNLGRTVSKRYECDVLDFAAAQTAAGALVDDLQAVTEGEVLSYTVGQRTAYSGTLTSGANFDEGATLSVRKADNKKAVMRIPAPIQAMRQAGTDSVDTTNADVIAYVNGNFITGDFLISDGEVVTALLSGKIDR